MGAFYYWEFRRSWHFVYMAFCLILLNPKKSFYFFETPQTSVYWAWIGSYCFNPGPSPTKAANASCTDARIP